MLVISKPFLRAPGLLLCKEAYINRSSISQGPSGLVLIAEKAEEQALDRDPQTRHYAMKRE